MDSLAERALRDRIIDDVLQRAEVSGGFLTWEDLRTYRWDGDRLPLVDQMRGIRNPAGFESTLAIVSSPTGPYDDPVSAEGFLHYSYRDYPSGDPLGGDNRKLRRARDTGLPLILFRKEEAGIYTPIAPVFVVDDYPEQQNVMIAFDEAFRYFGDLRDLPEPQRAYARRLAKQRLHQPAFRTRVIHAYQTRCAVCRLHHGSLLDAAHIVPDSAGSAQAPGLDGAPTVDNGLALCKIHHSAYDQNMLGVRPDYTVQIALRLLEEKDGPMLRYGLQEMHGQPLHLPSRRRDAPDRDRLAWRFEQFRQRV